MCSYKDQGRGVCSGASGTGWCWASLAHRLIAHTWTPVDFSCPGRELSLQLCLPSLGQFFNLLYGSRTNMRLSDAISLCDTISLYDTWSSSICSKWGLMTANLYLSSLETFISPTHLVDWRPEEARGICLSLAHTGGGGRGHVCVSVCLAMRVKLRPVQASSSQSSEIWKHIFFFFLVYIF